MCVWGGGLCGCGCGCVHSVPAPLCRVPDPSAETTTPPVLDKNAALGEAAEWEDGEGPSIEDVEELMEKDNEASNQDEDGMWSETFKSHADSKPYGTGKCSAGPAAWPVLL